MVRAELFRNLHCLRALRRCWKGGWFDSILKVDNLLIPIIVVCRLRLVFHLKLGRGWGDKEVRSGRVRRGWF